MAMQFNDSDEEIIAEINITPLTDVFLVLLIIFMISSSAILEGGLQVKLPSSKSGSAGAVKSAKPIYITVASDGRVSVNEQFADLEALGPILRGLLADKSEKSVVIRGDEALGLGRAVSIMDVARSAGAEKIAIATQNK